MKRFQVFPLLLIPSLAVAQSPQPVATAAPRRDSVTITFLANEGVLLSTAGHGVLIDALFHKYQTGYAVPAESTQSALARARPPFDRIDLVLVTHRHGDHFHPVPVVAHLAANPRARLVTSAQVVDSLRGRVTGPASDVTPRLVPRTMAPGLWHREVVNGIAVELLGLPHGGSRHRGVEHLAYVVELAGRRVLHLGDGDITEAALSRFRLDTARIDVALVPYWAVTSREGREVIERWIRPGQVVAFHVGEGSDMTRVSREVRSSLPGAITFTRSLETRRW